MGTSSPVIYSFMLTTAQGRKLRHVNGIALRNISEKPPVRPRGRSNDDASIAGSWRSPTQILTIKEEAALTHSKSSNDLRAAAAAAAQLNATDTAKGRRRRNTLRIDDPLSMQRLFEEAPSARLPDTFFTLHHSSVGGMIFSAQFYGDVLC